MNRILGPVFSLTLLIAFPLTSYGQDAAVGEKPAVKATKAQGANAELLEAQKRIDRLEAQMIEMQAVIGALQTMVQQGKGQLRQQAIKPDRIAPLNGRKTPDYKTNGWGADAKLRQESENTLRDQDFAIDEQPVSRARITSDAPKKLYDAGYNYLIANDYKAAETTFKSFLRNYPQSELSGNAQYWLGESYFARGQYRLAANEFLRGYKLYKQSQKAPDTLLKLGMSLQRLGQRDAACQTFAELKSKYKQLPGYVRRRLEGEVAQSGC